jgi:hypothetical protein
MRPDLMFLAKELGSTAKSPSGAPAAVSRLGVVFALLRQRQPPTNGGKYPRLSVATVKTFQRTLGAETVIPR